MLRPGNSINEISPVPIRRGENQQSSLRSSFFKQENESRIVRENYIRPPQEVQSESVIHRVTALTDKKPTQLESNLGSALQQNYFKQEKSTPYIPPPKMDYLSPNSPREGRLSFKAVKSSQSPVVVERPTVVRTSNVPLQTASNVQRTTIITNSPPSQMKASAIQQS